jgi:hypothetical protein
MELNELPEEFADEAQMARAVNGVFKSMFLQGNKTILLPVSLRSKTTYDPYWTTEDGKKELEQFVIEPSRLLDDLTPLVTSCLGQETVTCLKNNYADVRDFFERSPPKTQCGNIIGAAKGQPCWICGGLVKLGVKNGLQPECEHVFPIAQALVFTGLYESSFFDSLSDAVSEPYKVGLQMEYRWAHQICNQVKNDSHFIALTDGIFSIDDTKINSFLSKITNTDSWGGGKNLCRYLGNGNVKAGIDILYGRINDIRNTCKPVIDVITHLGITPRQHAISTVMYLKEYLATEPNCSKEEVIAALIPKASTGKLGVVTLKDAYAIVEYGIKLYNTPLSNIIFGKYMELLRNTLRNSGINASERARIIEQIAIIEQQYNADIKTDINSIIPSIRKKLVVYLSRHNSRGNVWSRFQVLSSQVIFAYIIFQTLTTFRERVNNISLTKFKPEQVNLLLEPTANPIFVEFVNKLFLEKMAKILPVLLKKPIDEGVDGYTLQKMASESITVLNTILNQPVEDVPMPNWFQSGGGNKHLLVRFIRDNMKRNITRKMRK